MFHQKKTLFPLAADLFNEIVPELGLAWVEMSSAGNFKLMCFLKEAGWARFW